MKIERFFVAASLSLTGVAFASFAGCGGVMHSMHSDHTGQHGTTPSPPQITLAPLALTLAPRSAQLAASFCPLLAQDQPLSTAASAGCRARGPAPSEDDLAFHIRVEARVASSNPIRLAVSSVLLVLTAYPDAGASQVLGTVCMTLCEEGASACPQTNESCRTTATNVADLGDFNGVEGFVTSVAVTEQRPADLAVRQVPAHGQVPLTIDLALDSERLRAAIRANDTAAVAAIRAGQSPSFTIPYAIEGTIWVDGRGNDGFAEPIARTTGTMEIGDD